MPVAHLTLPECLRGCQEFTEMPAKKPFKVYLAAPFFNPAQTKLCFDLEATMEDAGLVVFSPRKIFVCPPDADDATRESTFKGNVEHIKKADCVVAVLDYLLPPEQSLRVIHSRMPEVGPREGCTQRANVLSGPIRVPDAGTVFEIGLAYQMKKPVVGFYKGDAKVVNLMLAKACRRIVVGIEEFESWTANKRGGRPDLKAKTFEGKII